MYGIAGFMPLSLNDVPGRLAATIFVAGCNLRCPWCHNRAMIDPNWRDPEGADWARVEAYLSARGKMLDAVCISGGEPTERPDLEALIDAVRALVPGLTIKLDTNGLNPDRLAALLDSGRVDEVAMDLKNAPDALERTVGVADVDRDAMRRSVALLCERELPVYFRTTVIREFHSPEQLMGLADWGIGERALRLQRYQRPPGEDAMPWHPYSDEEMAQLVADLRPRLPGVYYDGN